MVEDIGQSAYWQLGSTAPAMKGTWILFPRSLQQSLQACKAIRRIVRLRELKYVGEASLTSTERRPLQVSWNGVELTDSRSEHTDTRSQT